MDNFKLKAIALGLKDKGVLKIVNTNNSRDTQLFKFLIFFEYENMIFCKYQTANPYDLTYPNTFFRESVDWCKLKIDGFLFDSKYYGGFLKKVTSSESFSYFIFEQLSYLPSFLNSKGDVGNIPSRNEIKSVVKKFIDEGTSNLDIYNHFLKDLNFQADKFLLTKDFADYEIH